MNPHFLFHVSCRLLLVLACCMFNASSGCVWCVAEEMETKNEAECRRGVASRPRRIGPRAKYFYSSARRPPPVVCIQYYSIIHSLNVCTTSSSLRHLPYLPMLLFITTLLCSLNSTCSIFDENIYGERHIQIVITRKVLEVER